MKVRSRPLCDAAYLMLLLSLTGSGDAAPAMPAAVVDGAAPAAVVDGAAPAASSQEPTLKKGQSPLCALPIGSRVSVPKGPAWLGIGYGSVWLSKSQSHRVFRIDPAKDRVVATIPVGSDPELGIGVGLGSVWIADPVDHTLTQIDPIDDRIVRTLPVAIAADPEGSIGVGFGSIWLLTNELGSDSGTLTRIDALSGKVVNNIPVRPQSHAVLVAFGSVWVSGSGDGTVTRVDPRRNAVIAQIKVPALPRFMAAGAGSLWVLTQSDGSLARIDPRDNRVSATIDVGVPGDGGDLTVADGSVWVSAEGVPLSQIDPKTNRLLRQFVGGRKDDTLRVGYGAAWVVDEDNGEIWKIKLTELRRRR